jgi:hypothetical protein
MREARFGSSGSFPSVSCRSFPAQAFHPSGSGLPTENPPVSVAKVAPRAMGRLLIAENNPNLGFWVVKLEA